jgi:hypothetical protein
MHSSFSSNTILLTIEYPCYLLLFVVIDSPEEEELPKVSTKILKEQFEKSAQENFLRSDKETSPPAKCMKVR